MNTFTSAIAFSEFKLNSDGLIPVVVQDYKTDEVLMVAYMNEEAFEKTIATGKMTYYSRSRQELWVKGLTSGHFQYVRSIEIDCDNDTLLAKVKQVGAACHTGNRSCFYRNLVSTEYAETNPLKVFNDVMNVIEDRKQHPKEGSYTNYLFDKGIDKILKKCGEEATEIIIAAKNPDPEEIKYEISDFLYHVMVLMVLRGVTWEDIVKELAAACAKQGIKLHFYYSHLDWAREDYPWGRTGQGTGRSNSKGDWKSYYQFMNNQLTELLTNYGPIGAIWFDGWWDQDGNPGFNWELPEQYAMIHKLQPGCLIGNNHHQTPFAGEDIQIFERD